MAPQKTNQQVQAYLASTQINSCSSFRGLADELDRLTDDIEAAKLRVKQLETALRPTEAHLVGDETHPLPSEQVSSDGLAAHETFDDGTGDLTDAIGAISIAGDGKAKYYGETASSEVRSQPPTIWKFTILHTVSTRTGEIQCQSVIDPDAFDNLIITQDADPEWNVRDPAVLGMPRAIIKLFNAFPMGLTNCVYDISSFFEYIPSRERALELVDLYYCHVAWMYVLRSLN